MDEPYMALRLPSGRRFKTQIVDAKDFDCEKCAMRLELRGFEMICREADSLLGLRHNYTKRERKRKDFKEYRAIFVLDNAEPTQSGDAAVLRKALESIASIDIGTLQEPIDGDSSSLYQNAKWDGKKFLGKEIPAWYAVGWYRSLKDAIATAKAALSTTETRKEK